MKGDDDFFDKEFIDLLNWMLQYLPKDRPGMPEIKTHKYLQGETATKQEIMKEFNARRERI